MATTSPDFDYLEIFLDGQMIGLLPVPKGTTCAIRPKPSDITQEQLDNLIPVLDAVPGYMKQPKGCELLVEDFIKALYFFRNVGEYAGESYNNNSLFLDAEANGKNVIIQFLGLDGTVVKTVPATKVMDPPAGGISKPGLFPGKVKYQSLMNADNVGKFRFVVSIEGTDLTKTFNCVVDADHMMGQCAEGPGGTLTQTDSGNQNPGSGNPGTSGGEEDETDVEFINL